MLIHLDASGIADAAGASGSAGRSLDSIESLLRAHHAGKHVVSLRREDARALSPVLPRLSQQAQAALRKIVGALYEIETLRREVTWHIELGIGPVFDGRACARGDHHVVQASLHHFDDFERAARSVLLAENLTDAELYEAMGRALMAWRGWRAQLAFQWLPGGGDTTADIFRSVAADGRILLAVVDSDRKYPSGPPGRTAKRLSSSGLPAFQRFLVLHVREAENLLPFELYEEALAPHPRSPSAPERLLSLQRVVPSTVLSWHAHVDLKKGLRLYRVRQMPPDSEEKSFWSELCHKTHREDCLQAATCQKESDCVCIVVEGLGEHALEHAVRWLCGQGPRRLANLLSFERDRRLVELCEIIVAWGLAPAGRPS